MLNYHHCRSRLSCDFVITRRLFLVILSLISALPVIRMEDEEGPWYYDVEGIDEPDHDSIVIIDDDGEEDEDSLEEYGPTKNVDDSRNEDERGEDHENIRTAERLNRDYVEIPRSTNDFERHSNSLMTSSNGTINIVVDMLVVVDNKIFTRFLQRHNNNTNDTKLAVKKYYRHVFGVANSRYSGINDSELSIRIRLVGIFVAQKRSSSQWSDKIVRRLNDTSEYINPYEGYEKFINWLNKRNGTLPKYDHAMAFTGYKMIKQDGTLLGGLAIGPSNCQFESGRASSLIQERFGFSSVSVAVHELGHALGPDHDGESPNENCPATDNYIMAPSFYISEVAFRNSFLFSPCSIRHFKSVLSSMDIGCLLDSVADRISVLPGQAFSPDYQCKDYYGPNSGLCQNLPWPRPDNFCTTLWCLNPDDHNLQCITDDKNQLTPVLGSPCADGKVCKNGQCLNKTVVLESMNELGGGTTRTKRNTVDLNAERTLG